MSFVHTQGHSTYSFLEGLGSTKALAQKAKEMGMSALALTDYNGMYGCIDFYLACKDVGIKPLIGVELNLGFDQNHALKNDAFITLIAHSTRGYRNLLALTSKAFLHGHHEKPLIDYELLQTYNEGIIALVGGKHSVIGNCNNHQALDICQKLQTIFTPAQEVEGEVEEKEGEKGTGNIQRLYINMIAQDDEKSLHTQLYDISEKLSLPCVVNTNYHYIVPSDKEAYIAALAIKDGKKLYDQDKRTIQGEHHLHSPQDLQRLAQKYFSDYQWESWIQNSVHLANDCNINIELRKTLFPNYQSAPLIKEKFEMYKERLVQE